MHPHNISVFSSLILLITISYHPSKCKKLALEPSSNFHPEENPGSNLFEGDIIISDEEEVSSMTEGVAGAGILGRHYRWPNHLIPYVISSEYKSRERGIILEAMEEISRKTCMRFQERDSETNFVYIHDPGVPQCSSYIGRQNIRLQTLRLSVPGCFINGKGTVIHELMHTIGFLHEQSRTDRDQYVQILTDNIEEANLGNFANYTSTQINEFEVPYDYGSIMHYGPYSFNKIENLKTIVPLNKSVVIGQRIGLSYWDVMKINRMNCPHLEPEDTRPQNPPVYDKLTSHGGHECVSECRKSGEAHDWCYISKESQGARHGAYSDYCTPHEDQLFILESRAIDGVVSAHGIPCGSKCEKDANSINHRCTTLNPWNSNTEDFCSPRPGYDHGMRKCFTKCEYTANRFKWCYIEGGGSGYCSKTRPAANLPVAEPGTVPGSRKSAHGRTCLTKCEKTDGRIFNTCKTRRIVNHGQDWEYWDYCSAQPGHNAWDGKCTSKCGYHGRISSGKKCRVSETIFSFCSQ